MEEKIIQPKIQLKTVDFVHNASKYPVVPTLINKDWLPVFIVDGIQTISLCSPNYGKNFTDCKTACDVHNQFAGLSKEKVTLLYSQYRF